MDEKYKIGWYDSTHKRRYIIVSNKQEALAEIADKMCISDQVSVKKISTVHLEKGGKE